MSREVIFTNAWGKSARLNDRRPYILTKLDGISAAKAAIFTRQAPYQDGVGFSHATLDPRLIVLEGAIPRDENLMDNRRRLTEVFNVGIKKPGELLIRMGEREKKINCLVDTAPLFPDEQEPYQRFQILLFAQDPYLTDVLDNFVPMMEWEGGAEFPLQWPTIFAFSSPKQTVTIQNNGDVPAPIKIDFYGPAVNPKVEKLETGEYIMLNRTLSENEVLSIDTSFGNKTVTLKDLSTGEVSNGFGQLDLSSVFLSLDVGVNTLHYSAGQTTVKTKVEIRFAERFVGL